MFNSPIHTLTAICTVAVAAGAAVMAPSNIVSPARAEEAYAPGQPPEAPGYESWRNDWRSYYGEARPGRHFSSLPPGHSQLRVKGRRYYYRAGVFYRPRRSHFVVVRAPIGARVAELPPDYTTFWADSRRYFYVNRAYYVFDPARQMYRVVARPRGMERPTAYEGYRVDGLVIYPEKGQSEERLRKDSDRCRSRATREIGYPGAMPPYAGPDHDRYLQALSACLEDRNYRVR